MLLNNNIDTYIIIDIFETLVIAMTYMLTCEELNDYEMIYCESPEELEFHGKRKIIFINYYKYKNFIGKYPHIDLFINSNSFVEMPLEIMRDYFTFIQSFDNTYLFSFNASTSGRIKDKKTLNSSHFPYDNKWKHIFSVHIGDNLSKISRRN